jgi:adenosylcobinamide-GDP ribazoletransferase
MPYLSLARAADLIEALGFLTRFPVPQLASHRGAAAAWAWPLAGALVGLWAAALASLALWAGLPAGVAAALALAAQALPTGALHEDGLADSADGLWGGGTRERRLEIMRDSRIGSYGALALMLGVLIRWTALSAILAQGEAWGALIAAGALSRWPMLALLWALQPAREGGLSRLIGRPATATLVLAGTVAILVAVIIAGWTGLGAALAVLAVTTLWAPFVRARLGGQTGDTCGAAQQLAEVAALLVLAA